jgi:hypothetical protein
MKNSFTDRLSSLGALAATFALAMAAVSPVTAGPVTTFAQYTENPVSAQQWTISTSAGTTTVSATGAVFFTMTGLAPNIDALFTLNATSTQLGNCGVICGTGDSYAQPGYSGTFSIIDTDSGPLDGDNLLSGTFAIASGLASTTGAQLSSNIGSSGASFKASDTSGNLTQITFTSAVMSFATAVTEDASWTASSLIPSFAVGSVTAGQAFPSGTFNASGVGTFSDQTSISTQSAVPEPATLCLFGGGLLALGLARRKKFSGR